MKQNTTWRDRFHKRFIQGLCQREDCTACSPDRELLKEVEEFIAREMKRIV